VKLANNDGVFVYEYKTLDQGFGIKELSNKTITDFFEDSGYAKVYSAIYIAIFIWLFISYSIFVLIDVLILSLLALITVKLYKINLTYKQCFSMSVYAFTLPLILNVIYIFVNTFTGFTMEYFQIMYNIISYIYIITAILMIKVDYNKTGSDLMKIIEEVKKDEKNDEIEQNENQNQEENNKDDNKEKKDENKKEKKEKNNGGITPEPGKA